MTETPNLCGHPSPFKGGGEPCPLEKGHEVGHVFYTQTAQPGQKRRRNGIWIVDEEGKTLMHATFEGYADPEDIWALMVLREIAAGRMKP